MAFARDFASGTIAGAGALFLTTALVGTAAHAAGIDRSGQDISIIFSDEARLLQFSGSLTKPDAAGIATTPGGPVPTGNGQEDYTNLSLGYKSDFNDKISYAFIIDEPYGSNVEYPIGGAFTGPNPDGVTDSLSARLDTVGITGVVRYEISERVSVLGGLRAVQGDGSIVRPGDATTAYSLEVDADWGFGYIIGAAYEIPEIALLASLTYTSATDHDTEYSERVGIPSTVQTNTQTLTLPEAVKLSFQTGIMADTLAFGSIRWSNYSDFEIAPPVLTPAAGPLVSYEDDTWEYQIGIGRRFSENWSGSFAINYEPTTDTTSPTPLSPSDGRIGYTIGAQYENESVIIAGGIRYTDAGDEVIPASSPTSPSISFTENESISYGLRISFKL